MKEIEYRAFDKERGKMLSALIELHFDGNCFAASFISSLGDETTISREQLELMQYIDRYDKNKRKIFEDDILKTDELNWIGVVAYSYDSFMLFDGKDGFSHPTWERCEVIGNRWENPNMMEKYKLDIETNTKEQVNV